MSAARRLAALVALTAIVWVLQGPAAAPAPHTPHTGPAIVATVPVG